jgi:hypothetical protein
MFARTNSNFSAPRLFLAPPQRPPDVYPSVAGAACACGSPEICSVAPQQPFYFQIDPHSLKRVRISLKTKENRQFVSHLFSINCALFFTLFLEVLYYEPVPQIIGGVYPPPPTGPEALTTEKITKYRSIIDLSAAPREPHVPRSAPRFASNLKLHPACSRAARGVTLL